MTRALGVLWARERPHRLGLGPATWTMPDPEGALSSWENPSGYTSRKAPEGRERMNFSENERTGALAEMDVQRLFTSWSWSTGKDRIDVGYDLVVEPDHSRFRGLRFLVQVKGTARQKKGAPTAPVSKANLRKYAANRIPVFLIRSDVDGALYWMHVQPWIRLNPKCLRGSGDATLVLPKDQRLDEREAFERYLESVLRPASERTGGLAEVAHERSEFLSALDPRFIVRVGLQAGAETYEISARAEPAPFQMHLVPKGEPGNVDKLRDVVQYGLPATIEVESARMSGSEIFSAIGADAVSGGSVSIGSASPKRGVVRLYPGNRYSMLATALSLPAQLYKGQKGFAVVSDQTSDLLEFKLRADTGIAQVTLGFRGDRLASTPIQECTQLATVGEWAREVMTDKGVFIELEFLGHRFPLHSREMVERMKDVLYYLFLLGRLHQVARALNSSLVVTEDLPLSKEDISSIHLLHAILQGQRKRINLGPIEFTAPILVEVRGRFLITTELELHLADQVLGPVPVAIDLEGYVLEMVESPVTYRLAPGADSQAVMYYNEGGAVDAVIAPVHARAALDGENAVVR